MSQPFFSFLSPPRALGHRHLREHLGTANAPSQPLFSFLSSRAPPPPSHLTSWAPQVAAQVVADLGASSLAAQVAADLGRRMRDLTADVQALRRQVSAERRSDVARRYLAVARDALTEEQLDCLLTSSTEDPSVAAM